MKDKVSNSLDRLFLATRKLSSSVRFARNSGANRQSSRLHYAREQQKARDSQNDLRIRERLWKIAIGLKNDPLMRVVENYRKSS
jgi:hypothetical protein